MNVKLTVRVLYVCLNRGRQVCSIDHHLVGTILLHVFESDIGHNILSFAHIHFEPCKLCGVTS